MTDPIADMLIRIKNGYSSRKQVVVLPWSRTKESLAKVLVKNKYLDSASVKEDSGKKTLVLDLRYEDKRPAISDLRRVSTPSLRVYVGKKQIPRVLGGLGMAIISTPLGLMTDKQAKKSNIGGEVWCEIW